MRVRPDDDNCPTRRQSNNEQSANLSTPDPSNDLLEALRLAARRYSERLAAYGHRAGTSNPRAAYWTHPDVATVRNGLLTSWRAAVIDRVRVPLADLDLLACLFRDDPVIASRLSGTQFQITSGDLEKAAREERRSSRSVITEAIDDDPALRSYLLEIARWRGRGFTEPLAMLRYDRLVNGGAATRELAQALAAKASSTGDPSAPSAALRAIIAHERVSEFFDDKRVLVAVEKLGSDGFLEMMSEGPSLREMAAIAAGSAPPSFPPHVVVDLAVGGARDMGRGKWPKFLRELWGRGVRDLTFVDDLDRPTESVVALVAQARRVGFSVALQTTPARIDESPEAAKSLLAQLTELRLPDASGPTEDVTRVAVEVSRAFPHVAVVLPVDLPADRLRDLMKSKGPLEGGRRITLEVTTGRTVPRLTGQRFGGPVEFVVAGPQAGAQFPLVDCSGARYLERVDGALRRSYSDVSEWAADASTVAPPIRTSALRLVPPVEESIGNLFGVNARSWLTRPPL